MCYNMINSETKVSSCYGTPFIMFSIRIIQKKVGRPRFGISERLILTAS